MEFLRRLNRRSRIGVRVLIFVLLSASLYSLFWGFTSQLVLDDVVTLSNRPPKDLWFTSDGSLIVLEEDGGNVVLRRWSADEFKQGVIGTSYSLSFGAKLEGEARYSLRVSYPVTLPLWTPYAISRDATKLVWWHKGSIIVRELGRDVGKATPAPLLKAVLLENSQAVEAVAFVDEARVSVLYGNGQLEIWDVGKGKKVFGTNFEGKCRLWTQGTRLALSAFDSRNGDVFTVDLTSPDGRVGFLPQDGFLNGNALALSPNGRLAVGTTDGLIVLYEDFSNIPLNSSAINAMAFYDEKRMVVGGAFSGLYIVTIGNSPVPMPLTSTPTPEVALLALSKEHLAYSTLVSTVVGSLRERRVSTSTNTAMWRYLPLVISVMAFVLAAARDQK